MRRALIGLGAVLIAVSLANRAQGSGFNFSGVDIPQSIVDAANAGYSPIPIYQNQTPQQAASVSSDRLSISELKALIAQIDGFEFGNYFNSGQGPSRGDVYAIMNVESARKPSAVNWNDPRGGAWGLGQVLAEIAKIDYGIADPSQLLQPYIGASVSMRHMQWTFNALSAGLGRIASASEFIQAYNVGVTGYVSGRRNLGYLAKVTAARLV